MIETNIIFNKIWNLEMVIWKQKKKIASLELQLETVNRQVVSLRNTMEDKRQRKNENQRRLRAERKERSKDDNDDDTYKNPCKVCFDAEVNSVIKSCSHSSCLVCALRLQDLKRPCPFCLPGEGAAREQ